MAFDSRDEFIAAQTSEKITLAHVHARARLLEWTVHAGDIYKKVVPYFSTALKQDQTDLTSVADLGSVVAGTFFYDPLTSTLYSHMVGDVDPVTVQVLVTYRFFYASGPTTVSYDLTDAGAHVYYEGRILSSPGYNHKIGIDQGLTSIVGSGTLKLENGDGGLDNKFDALYYENRQVEIYSWNRDLPFSEAKIIYRGRITNKSYDPISVSFKIKDTLFDLEQALPLTVYDDTDNVNTSIKGRYKRWAYGRIDGMKIQSTDQIVDGYAITGTVAGTAAGLTLTGTGTTFLSETSPGDEITIGTQEFTIEVVVSDTEITLDDEVTFAFTGQTATLVPEIPTTNKNRIFFVTGHACSDLSYDIIQYIQLNRIELSSTTGLEAGDFLEFVGGERKEIKTVAPGNIVVLRSNLIIQPALPSTVTRQPIQRVYKESSLIQSDNYTITNEGSPNNRCLVTLDSDVEFVLARETSFNIDLSFTNASRSVTTVDDVDLRDTFSPRDFLRPADLTYTTYYEILSVDTQSMELRVVFADPTITDTVTAKLPDYIGDDTILSAELIGKTEDGEPGGVWIETGAQAVRDMISEVGISSSLVNTTSFDQAETDSAQIISLTVPLTPTGKSTSAKSAVNLINKSIFGSLTLDNDLKLFYKILQTDVPDDPVRLYDEDLIKWNIKTSNGKNFKDSVVGYKHVDVDRQTLASGSSTETFSSDFVRDYIGTSKLKEFEAYMFLQNEAANFAERQVYYNRLSQSTISLETDLRLEGIQLGDVIQLEMDRLYSRLGDPTSSKKLALVVGKTVTGDTIKFILTDIGNLYNTSAVISLDTTNEYASATEDEKLKYGFITDSQGIVDSDEDTDNTNLIS